MIFLMAVAVPRRPLRHLAGGLRLGAVVPRLQLLLHRAPLHLHDRPAARAAGARHLPGHRRRHLGRGGAHPRAGAVGGGAHARDAAALRIHAPALGRRRATTTSPEAAVAEIHASLGRPAAVLLARDGELELRAAWPPEEALDTASMTAARWAIEHDEPAGADTATLPAVPVAVPAAEDGRVPPSAWSASAAMNRGRAGSRRRARCSRRWPSRRRRRSTAPRSRARWWRRAARPRPSACATRCSPRSPTTSARRLPRSSGSATSLIDYGDKLGDQDRRQPAGRDPRRGRRPRQMVRNLLAMTRIEAGALDVRRDWVDRARDRRARRRAQRAAAVPRSASRYACRPTCR